MKNKNVFEQEFGFACYNCGRMIIPGERMLTMSASLETPNWDGSVDVIENSAISIVCSSCASILSSELEITVSGSNDRVGKSALNVRCSKRGFQFELHCSDGFSWAVSPIYTWQQIFQMSIAMDPNMFGDLSEPLHRVFPKNLKMMGYYIPNWNHDEGKAS